MAYALLGGVFIGTAASLLHGGLGRVAGVSGILAGLAPRARTDYSNDAGDEQGWRALFIAGLVVGGAALWVITPQSFGTVARSWPALALAGLLVGYGARLGSGCTSGHGVCGISRLSPRSLVATGVFMATGMITVFVVNHLAGGTL